MYNHRPLQIIAHLGTPVVGDFAHPLDGILLAEGMKSKYGALPTFKPGIPSPFDPDTCPLDIFGAGTEYWFYACSFAVWGDYVEMDDYWNKRLDLSYGKYLRSVRSINISSGRYKAYHYRIFYRYAKTIFWSCKGDAQAISALLPNYIGKKQSQGWGRVLRWQILPALRFDLIQDGVPCRAIPVQYLDAIPVNANVRYRTYRPPYWDIDHREMCVTP